jgi:hypothetical protein
VSDPKKNFVANEAELKSLCRAYTRKNVETLGGWATGDNINEDLKMRAIGILMDRGWGKPSQDNTHEVKGEIKVVLRKMLEDDDE